MTNLTDIVATLARLEERQEHVVEKIDDLATVAVHRLNHHAGRIDSLETTRDRQRGAAKLAAVLAAMAGSLFASLRFWD